MAGWYRQGTKPGDTGPAVVVGHVDSHKGPAVFYRLRELQRDDRITVSRTDGSKVVFAVYASERVAKDHFPTRPRVRRDATGRAAAADLRRLFRPGQQALRGQCRRVRQAGAHVIETRLPGAKGGRRRRGAHVLLPAGAVGRWPRHC